MRLGHFELNILIHIMKERVSQQAHGWQCLPLANSEVTRWTAAQIAALSIGTAIAAGGL